MKGDARCVWFWQSFCLILTSRDSRSAQAQARTPRKQKPDGRKPPRGPAPTFLQCGVFLPMRKERTWKRAAGGYQTACSPRRMVPSFRASRRRLFPFCEYGTYLTQDEEGSCKALIPVLRESKSQCANKPTDCGEIVSTDLMSRGGERSCPFPTFCYPDPDLPTRFPAA